MFVDAYYRKDIILPSAVPNISKENHYPKALAIHFEARIVECGKKKTRDKAIKTSHLAAICDDQKLYKDPQNKTVPINSSSMCIIFAVAIVIVQM